MAEIDNDPKNSPVPPTAAVTADEKRREGDRLRKQKQRERQRDPEAAHVANRPGGQTSQAPPDAAQKPPMGNPFAGFRTSWGTFTKKAGEPVGGIEATRQLWHMHTAIGRIIRSEADFKEQEFEEAGHAFEEVANHWFPWLRIVVRIGAPLLLIGALIQIWSKMLSETPWWVRFRENRGQPVVEVVPDLPQQPRDPMQPGQPVVNQAGPENGTVPHPPPLPRLIRR